MQVESFISRANIGNLFETDKSVRWIICTSVQLLESLHRKTVLLFRSLNIITLYHKPYGDTYNFIWKPFLVWNPLNIIHKDFCQFCD